VKPADALAVAALLAFALGWTCLWWFHADWDKLSGEGGPSALLVLALFLGPPAWAGSLVSRIVRGPDDSTL
jgi:hypothetical protein